MIAINILPNILRSKDNQTIKLYLVSGPFLKY